ncbi:hypothetical protein OPT61_g8494 [Boeremia exigua]|uniref:Uncharacterized protein n=1 Tax=Boeremia exigua TaxID=749465 RepID=A0ACC2HYV3_9PLEO|nr:hypothetical protein OPT61_g8494 [Boeremia exigua]
MSFSDVNFFPPFGMTTELKFVDYTPNLTRSTQIKAKRKKKSGGCKLLENCAEIGNTTTPLKPTTDFGLFHTSNASLNNLSETANSCVSLVETVLPANAAAHLQGSSQHEARDLESVVEQGMYLVDTEKTTANSIGVLTTLSTSADCTSSLGGAAITEDHSLMSADYSIDSCPPNRDIGCRSLSSGGYSMDMEERANHTGALISSKADANTCSQTGRVSYSRRPTTATFTTDELACLPSVRSSVDQGDKWQERQMAYNHPESSPLPAADVCVSASGIDCNGELVSSIESASSHLNDNLEHATELGVQEDSLHSSDDRHSASTGEHQSRNFGLATSSDRVKENDLNDLAELGTSDEEEADRHEVERIISHDEHRGWKRYLVKWYGWPAEANTWEPATNLDRCPEVVREYLSSVEKSGITGSACGGKDRLNVLSERELCDWVPLLQPMVKALDGVVQTLLTIQDSLEPPFVRTGASNRAASGCAIRKRKVLPGLRSFLSKEEVESDDHPYAEKAEDGSRKRRGQMAASRRSKRRCGPRKAAGHDFGT